jgi:cardiolipin synthase A/B
MDLLGEPAKVWRYLVAALTIFISVVASGHALLFKKDSRSAVLWVSLIWLTPLVGAVLYFLLGVNRIRRKAVLLRGGMERFRAAPAAAPCEDTEIKQQLPEHSEQLCALARVVNQAVERPLLPGNLVEPLVNGDAAYPAMLGAIASAKTSISLSTYIFDRDEAGLAFAAELGKAVRRGVSVRVLIDATGTRYSWPPILGTLRREKVPYARFLPAFRLWRLMSINLRNHRKILVVDGRVGFTGGMNIRVGHWLEKKPSDPVQDLHFRVEGPVVSHLQEDFADDWNFTTGESLRGDAWFPPLESCGSAIVRGITDGPDEDYDKLRWTILGGLAAARESVRIATPYFLPDSTIISALNLAAMRGVRVEILLPEKNNLPFVHWASRAHWWQVLERNCQIWLTPPPFDHTKIMLVDSAWAMVGSANWDPRSLRLNFEFNLECYDADLAQNLGALMDKKLKKGRRVTLEEVDGRSVPIRLRDGIARLFTPFL